MSKARLLSGGRVEESGVVALDRIERLLGAILAGGIEPEPVIELVTDAARLRTLNPPAAVHRMPGSGTVTSESKVERMSGRSEEPTPTSPRRYQPPPKSTGSGATGSKGRRGRQIRRVDGLAGAERHRSCEKKGFQLAHVTCPL